MNELLRLLTDEPKEEGKVEDWFDRIAKQLLLNNELKVNNTLLEFTEIEFYFFKTGFHEDRYTHEHDRNAGEWRFHNSGMDITFKGDKNQDGGILIRGIKDIKSGEYINGPRNVISHFGKSWGKVTDENKLSVVEKTFAEKEILRTARHLPNKVEYQEYHYKNYRYIIELENNKNLKHIKRENCIPL